MIDEARLSHARKIAETRYAFWWHLGAYAVVNTALVGIWLAVKRPFRGRSFRSSSGGSVCSATTWARIA